MLLLYPSLLISAKLCSCITDPWAAISVAIIVVLLLEIVLDLDLGQIPQISNAEINIRKYVASCGSNG